MRDLSRLFSALADPTRLRLLHLMRDGEICVCFLHGVLRTNQPKTSRHLAYLRKAGLVEARRDGKWMHYRIRKQEGKLQQILTQTLDQVRKEALAKKDAQRLSKIRCCPARFGFSSP
jgi:ArsR family transcriptional regulator